MYTIFSILVMLQDIAQKTIQLHLPAVALYIAWINNLWKNIIMNNSLPEFYLIKSVKFEGFIEIL